MKNKVLIVGIIILIGIITFEGVFIFINWNKGVESEENFINIPDENSQENLYHLTFYDRTIYDALYIYDIYITSDGKTKYFVLEDNNEIEYLDSYFDNAIYTDSIALNEEELNYLNDILSNLEYTLSLGDEYNIELGDIVLINYSLQKGIMVKESDSDISYIVRAIIDENKDYFSYLLSDNDVLNYIKDTNYNELDVNNSIIQELYQNVNNVFNVCNLPDNYQEESLTNDYIITYTLESGNVDYESKEVPGPFSPDEMTTNYYYDNKSLDREIKRLFGNVSYDISSFMGVGECEGYAYDEKEKQIYKWFGTGCGLEYGLQRELIFAYEVNDNLVLVEATLFFNNISQEIQDNNGNSIYLPRGIYNSYTDRLLLKNYNNYDNLYEDVQENFKQYELFYTYYSYTFSKNSDGNYYLVSFERIN